MATTTQSDAKWQRGRLISGYGIKVGLRRTMGS